ncbi:hypothetical protein FNV43_RR17041 [Rhamnella rubrinervis]|uniref:Uncharacterized protein n=1 Tax=Rhamnella rubrinervis TaxID=2594499 RepID=A0A8K0ME43_9ROSA|nr:hypothetical protein FNV43_RR17041 [Rhamnella rubrinervis]
MGLLRVISGEEAPTSRADWTWTVLRAQTRQLQGSMSSQEMFLNSGDKVLKQISDVRLRLSFILRSLLYRPPREVIGIVTWGLRFKSTGYLVVDLVLCLRDLPTMLSSIHVAFNHVRGGATTKRAKITVTMETGAISGKVHFSIPPGTSSSFNACQAHLSELKLWAGKF